MLTVIIPVYNKEKYLPDAIESVLRQRHVQFEIIIVDDGSTDSSGRLADKFALRDKRIRVIHQENQWIYAAFNRGIQEAQGDYFYILNADDMLEDNKLKLLNEKIKEYNFPDVIWTKCVICHCNENHTILKKEVLGQDNLTELFFQQKEETRKNWLFS